MGAVIELKPFVPCTGAEPVATPVQSKIFQESPATKVVEVRPVVMFRMLDPPKTTLDQLGAFTKFIGAGRGPTELLGEVSLDQELERELEEALSTGKSEAERKKRNPQKKARRWVVEACHGWFNRFRKLLVRYEKLEHTFLALNHLAAAIITLRKISLPVNIIYG